MNEINDFLEILKHSSVDMGREIKELTSIMDNCISISCKVSAYIEAKGDCQKANID
jgi:glutamyl-tRNA reductase